MLSAICALAYLRHKAIMRRWGFIIFMLILAHFPDANSAEWALVFSGRSLMFPSMSHTCIYNIPSSEKVFDFEHYYSYPMSWSPSGNYLCNWYIRDFNSGVIKLPEFDTVATLSGWLTFIHGDTLACVTFDSINQTIYFLTPPNFSRIVDSVVFTDTTYRIIYYVTDDGRFWLFCCVFESTYKFLVYDRYLDSSWFVEDSADCYLSKKGFLVISKLTSIASHSVISNLKIVNLYHPLDTIFLSDIAGIGSISSYFSSCIAFSNNDSLIYIPFSYDTYHVKNGIFIYNLFSRTYIDTIDTDEIFQDTFKTITGMDVTNDGKYAAITLSRYYRFPPSVFVGYTLVFDIENHVPILTIDTVCNAVFLSFRPVPGKISEIRGSSRRNAKQEGNPTIHLSCNTLIVSNISNIHISTFSLLDLTGRTVHRWQVEPKDGDKVILPLPEGLPNGVYLLRAGGGKIVGKVVLVR